VLHTSFLPVFGGYLHVFSKFEWRVLCIPKYQSFVLERCSKSICLSRFYVLFDERCFVFNNFIYFFSTLMQLEIKGGLTLERTQFHIEDVHYPRDFKQ